MSSRTPLSCCDAGRDVLCAVKIRSGRPASVIVGTSSRIALRAALVTASGGTSPLQIWLNAPATVSNLGESSMCPGLPFREPSTRDPPSREIINTVRGVIPSAAPAPWTKSEPSGQLSGLAFTLLILTVAISRRWRRSQTVFLERAASDRSGLAPQRAPFPCCRRRLARSCAGAAAQGRCNRDRCERAAGFDACSRRRSATGS